MLTEFMQQQRLITGTWWAPLPSTTHEQRTRMVRSQHERQCRIVTYDVNTQAQGARRQVYEGLIEHRSSAWEPLALYVRLLYGDGVYYCPAEDGNIWFLIVQDGVIVPGTDCLLSPLVFDLLMEGRKFSKCKSLTVRELSQDCAEEMLTHYNSNQLRLKKRRYFMYIALVCVALVLLSIPLAFILIG